jgi:hypothetical protein
MSGADGAMPAASDATSIQCQNLCCPSRWRPLDLISLRSDLMQQVLAAVKRHTPERDHELHAASSPAASPASAPASDSASSHGARYASSPALALSVCLLRALAT